MKILITGSSGFVGSSVIKYLVNGKFQVETIGRAKVNKLAREFKVKYSVLNLEAASIRDFLHLKKFDILIHAAWQGLPDRTPINNAKNEYMSQLLFESFARSGGKQIIGFGSCLEYGDETGLIKETSLGRNLDDFGFTKRRLSAFVSNLEIPYLWLRPFYLYGANQHRNSLLNLSLQNLTHDNVEWLMNPLKTNDFVYVEDIGRIIRALIDENLWLGELNIGTSLPTLNGAFVNEIRDVLGKSRYKVSGTVTPGVLADSTKLKSALPNFQFSNLREGLRSSIPQLLERVK